MVSWPPGMSSLCCSTQPSMRCWITQPGPLPHLPFPQQLLRKMTWSEPTVGPDFFQHVGAMQIKSKCAQHVCKMRQGWGGFFLLQSQHHFQNPGQLWWQETWVTTGHSDSDKHTQACTWDLPRNQSCGRGSQPASAMVILQDSKEATAPATTAHIPDGFPQLKAPHAAQNTPARRTISLLCLSYPYSRLPFILGLFETWIINNSRGKTNNTFSNFQHPLWHMQFLTLLSPSGVELMTWAPIQSSLPLLPHLWKSHSL